MGYRSYIIFATEKISERPMNNTSAMTIVNKKSNLKEATYSMVMGAENLSSRNAGAQDNNCLVEIIRPTAQLFLEIANAFNPQE